MDGLEAIQERIAAQAAEKAAQIREQAAFQVAEIEQQAELVSAQILEAASQKAQAQTEAIRNRAQSQAALEIRREALSVRQQLIDQTIAAALTGLRQLPTERKLALYADMIRSLGTREGFVIANADDQDLVRTLLPQLPGSWTLDNQAGTFTGGLVVRRGRIEDNLTFDLLIRDSHPQLAALAASILYPDNGTA